MPRTRPLRCAWTFIDTHSIRALHGVVESGRLAEKQGLVLSSVARPTAGRTFLARRQWGNDTASTRPRPQPRRGLGTAWHNAHRAVHHVLTPGCTWGSISLLRPGVDAHRRARYTRHAPMLTQHTTSQTRCRSARFRAAHSAPVPTRAPRARAAKSQMAGASATAPPATAAWAVTASNAPGARPRRADP